jgi:hypothetical protein
MGLKLTVITRTLNVRKAPKANADLLLEKGLENGKQFDVIQLFDVPKSVEQWAKIVLPDLLNVDAYVCVRQPAGNYLCEVKNIPDPAPVPVPDGEYKRGKRDALQKIIRFATQELESLN